MQPVCAFAVVLAVGPMLDPVLAATAGLDVGVAYTPTVEPLDVRSLEGRHVILVEPYLAGTSVARLSGARRVTAIGVPNTEHRHYGTRDDHLAAHGLDAAGLRERIGRILR